MRARVRKDATQPAVPKASPSVPWSVRVASTLPKGARVSNPLLGEATAGTVAVFDLGMPHDLTMFAKADEAAHALFVDAEPWVEVLAARGYSFFRIDGDDTLLAANFDLPEVPWVSKDEALTEKGDLAIAAEDPGHLQPEQGRKYRRVRTKDAVIVDAIGLLTKSITKIEDEREGADERYILGIVLEPDEVDSQGDTISAEEIRTAAHGYMQDFGNVGLQHQTFVNDKIKILETYIAPVDFEIGGQFVKAGTWLMAFRVVDDSIWKAIKDGVLTGLSIGGSGLRLAVA